MDSPTEINWKEEAHRLARALQGVLNSACHPDICLRIVTVDAKPVRAALDRFAKISNTTE